MARNRRNNNPPPIPPQGSPAGVNWFNFFQSIDSKKGRIAVVIGIFTFGASAGFYAEKVIKDREILLLERKYNDDNTIHNIEKIKYERKISSLELDNQELKNESLLKTKDTVKNGKR